MSNNYHREQIHIIYTVEFNILSHFKRYNLIFSQTMSAHYVAEFSTCCEQPLK